MINLPVYTLYVHVLLKTCTRVLMETSLIRGKYKINLNIFTHCNEFISWNQIKT